jgi:dTDP-4-dehydrorhamnose 3,5-epimerase-like enzyme
MTFQRSTIHDCSIINLPKIGEDLRGSLSFVEAGQHVPFSLHRAYYLYDVPGGAERGGHAHKDLQQLIVAMSGSFEVALDDGHQKKTVTLNRPYYGLYVPTMIWRELLNFSSGSVLFVLASNHFAESDYYREYKDFVLAKNLPFS